MLIETNITNPYTSDLKGQVVVLVGGTGGIGQGIVSVLSQQGANIVIISRANQPIKNDILHIKADITKNEEIVNAISMIIKKFGRIDALVNCAGLFNSKAIDAVSEKEFDDVININLKGLFLTTRAVIPTMKKQKKGLIVNIGSKISHNTNVSPNKVLYATSKFAVEGFTISLAKELKKYGIRVSCLMLGTVNTFVSFKSKQYLSPENVGFVIAMLIKLDKIEFESIIMKSYKQNI